MTFGFAVLCTMALPAHALLTVSTHPTMRVSCSAGTCTATASKANLNVTDLQNMLAVSDVTLKPGSVASDILVNAPVYWTSTHVLGLDAYRGITVNRPMSVQGQGGLVLTTNDGGTGGDLRFTGNGRVAFWDLSSPLTINGNAHTLENSIAGLASAIAANPSGSFALADNYDAEPDGTYTTASPIATTFTGHFEGLGNTISNVTVLIRTRQNDVGLFSVIGAGGTVHDLHLVHMGMTATFTQRIGTLAGRSVGEVSYVTATGFVKTGHYNGESGGLIGSADTPGTVRRVQAAVTVPAGNGGLLGYNGGTLSESFTSSNVTEGNSTTGLLVGISYGSIIDCYAVGSASGNGASLGGITAIIGTSFQGVGSVANSYVAGVVTDLGAQNKGAVAAENLGTVSNVYWDTTTIDIGWACEPSNPCPGAVGLSDAELKSGLPAGFDPAIWGHDPAINSGLPYLLNNPPR
jgi:hypothetical protein